MQSRYVVSIAALGLAFTAPVQGQQQPASGRQEAEHRHHLGRRHRPVEHQRLLARPDGLRTPNIDRIARKG